MVYVCLPQACTRYNLVREILWIYGVTKPALEAAGIPFDQMLQILVAGITHTVPSVSILVQSKFIKFANNTIH
jgi:hypothetical protein